MHLIRCKGIFCKVSCKIAKERMKELCLNQDAELHAENAKEEKKESVKAAL